MKEITIETRITVCGYDELTEADLALVEEARKATYRSYSPYSHFSVGASIRLGTGEVVTGSNQENAAYPSGTCAERTACYYAHSRYPGSDFRTIAIAARATDGEFVADPIPPCGACRQALLEYEKIAGAPVRVILVGADKVYILQSVKSLLPLAFDEFE